MSGEAGWGSLLAGLAGDLRGHLGTAHRLARDLLGPDPVQVVAYRGYGTAERAWVVGRVLENERVSAATITDSRWRNLVNTLKRLESDEVPHARVRVTWSGAAHELTSDDDGYIAGWVTPAAPLPADRSWHPVALELISPIYEGAEPARTTGDVLVPPPSAEYGVISDLDDTVIRTEATDLVRMARATLFENARTRLPFPGVAAFYGALRQGAHGSADNPMFYVSSSPWNLYDLLTEFLSLQGIPDGPLVLRDWDLAVPRGGHAPHKLGAIARIMDTYPRLPFILIGDSGQEDPEIYREVVRRYPTRILAAYIRNVTPDPHRSAAIRALAAEVVEAGSTLILADDTLAAARHALERGWIGREGLGEVGEEKRKDEAGMVNPDKAETVVVEGGGT
ncbi:MAG: phosphatase domain-containing protein [Gemmatimonadaceae bacterium]